MHLIVYVVIGCGVVLSLSGGEESASTGSSHCFKRIAGGERLVGYDVTRIIERSSVGECEEECNVYRCTHFSFGNATDGNGTCELTTDREISRRQDPNFDLYQKTTECAEGKPTGYEKGKRARTCGHVDFLHSRQVRVKCAGRTIQKAVTVVVTEREALRPWGPTGKEEVTSLSIS